MKWNKDRIEANEALIKSGLVTLEQVLRQYDAFDTIPHIVNGPGPDGIAEAMGTGATNSNY